MTGTRTPGTPLRAIGNEQKTARVPREQQPRLGWILGLTSAACFMVVLDSLVVITALPQMQRDLGVGLPALQWTVNSYGIAFAAGIITAAALGDRLGRRRVFVAGLALFTLASAACALAPSASSLIAARAVQSLGGAAVLPLSLTILTTAYPPARRGAIVGIYGGLAGLAVAAGPLVGGAVTEGLDWRRRASPAASGLSWPYAQRFPCSERSPRWPWQRRGTGPPLAWNSPRTRTATQTGLHASSPGNRERPGRRSGPPPPPAQVARSMMVLSASSWATSRRICLVIIGVMSFMSPAGFRSSTKRTRVLWSGFSVSSNAPAERAGPAMTWNSSRRGGSKAVTR